MPQAIAIIHWNERSGPEIIVQYPTQFEISKNLMFQIYLNHQNDTEINPITFSNEEINIITYFSSEDAQLFVITFLTLDEKPELIEPIYVDFAKSITKLYLTEQIEKIKTTLPLFIENTTQDY